MFNIYESSRKNVGRNEVVKKSQSCYLENLQNSTS